MRTDEQDSFISLICGQLVLLCWGSWHVWERRKGHTAFWCRDLRTRDDLESLDIDGKKRIFKKWDVSVNWIDLTHDKNKTHGNTTLFSTKCKEYLDQLRKFSISRRTLHHGVSCLILFFRVYFSHQLI